MKAERLERYECASGRVIRYPKLARKVQLFLNDVIRNTEREDVLYDDLVTMIYGKGNPLLDHLVFKGYGGVTAEVAADPVYSVMRDQLEKKAIQHGMIVPERDFANLTMTAGEAAKKLGVHETAVVKAIQQGRLRSARKINGRWMIHPDEIGEYRVQTNKSRKAGRKRTA